MKRNFKKEIETIHNSITVLEPIKTGKDKVLLRCNIDGYEWRSRPYDLIKGHGCHMCKGVPRYTTETFTRKIKELNSNIEIIGEYKNATTKIEWQCVQCRSINLSRPNTLLSGHGCINCRNLQTSVRSKKTNEEFIKEVSILTNDYSILSEYETTDKKVKFRHNCCKFEFYMTPHNFLSNGNRCPKCNGGVRKKTTEYFKSEVKDSTNGEYLFIDKYTGNNYKSNFKHTVCLKEFVTTPDSFLRGTRCPYCYSTSSGEKGIEDYLTKINLKFVKEKTFDDLKFKRKLRFDFYIPSLNLCIEYDGRQHFIPIDIWGGEESLKENQMRDHMKNEYCQRNDINLLRINYKEKDIDRILKERIACMKKSQQNY